MPIPKGEEKKFGIIIASLRKKFRAEGMSKGKSNALSKQKAEKAVGV